MRPNGGQMAVADQHDLEQDARQPVPLRVVGVVPRGSRIPDVATEPIDHVGTTVRVGGDHAGELGPQFSPSSLVRALREISEHEQVSQSMELSLDRLSLADLLRRFRAGLASHGENAVLGVIG